MKKSLFITTILAVLVCFVSCQKTTTTYSPEDLVGRWQAPSMSQPDDTLQFRVFLAETASDEPEYRYGYEWDMGDHEGWDETKGTYEDFLLTKGNDGEYHGNGWYKWKLATNGDLTIINLMHNGGADIPKTYTVTTLTNTDLSFKDSFGKIHSFTKVKK